MSDSIEQLQAEVERLQLVADAAMDEIAFQRDINQQIGKENEQLKASNAALIREAQEAAEALLRTRHILSAKHAQNAALRGIAQTVADSDPIEELGEYVLFYRCFFCREEAREEQPTHKPDCKWLKARATLAESV